MHNKNVMNNLDYKSESRNESMKSVRPIYQPYYMNHEHQSTHKIKAKTNQMNKKKNIERKKPLSCMQYILIFDFFLVLFYFSFLLFRMDEISMNQCRKAA